MKLRHAHYLVILFLCFGLVGCANDDGQDQSLDVANFPYLRMSPEAPPQPYYEDVYPPSNPMAEVWRPGYWFYDGASFEWIPGEYLLRPDPTASWSPERWEQRAYGWVFVPGYWQ